MTRAIGSSVVGLAGLVLAACSSGETNTSCRDYTDCPTGQYCGPNKTCTEDCSSGSECPSGVCNSIGRCDPVKQDGGLEAGVDGLVGEGSVPDAGPPDQLAPDGQPDQGPQPDTGVPDLLVMDLFVTDISKVDAPSDGPPSDVMPSDGIPVPDGLPVIPCATVMGQPCTQAGFECGATASCLLTSDDGLKGVCTCSCIPDDPLTLLVNEDNCPFGGRCGSVALSGGTTANFCFKTCNPKIGSNDCQGALACDPRSGSAVGLFDEAVCMFFGCTAGTDCPVTTSTQCITTSPTPCGTGEQCIAVTSGTTDGYCAKAGQCDLVSRLCNAHTLGKATAKVGDPCTDDTQCGNAMQCLMQIDWSKYRKKGGQICTDDAQCCSGRCQLGQCTSGLCTVDNRNGYCTISGCNFAATLPIRACPAGSQCNILYGGGVCQQSCTLATASDCRGHTADLLGDYECRAWNNLAIGGAAITTSPVCDFGPAIACDIFGTSSTLDCAVLGEATNPTNMTCRGLNNGIKVNSHDPLGYCLDSTASGTQLRNPMPTP